MIERGTFARSGGDAAGSGVCVREIQREYLDDLKYRVTAAHFHNVELRLERTISALGARDIADLQPLSVIRYRNHVRDQGSSNRTANLVVDSLKSMFSWALETGLIETNPLRRVRRLPDGRGHQRYRRRALSDEEIDRFLAAAEKDDRETARLRRTNGGGKGERRKRAERVPQAAMWRAFLETGARWSELTRTRWADLDLKRKTLLLRAENTKSKRQRTLPLRSVLCEEFERLRLSHRRILDRIAGESDPLFLSPKGMRWSRPTNNVMRIFDRILSRAGIARVNADGLKVDIHALRHTFGSRLARNGAGLVQIQRLMGHADPKLTAAVYAHLDVEDLRSAIETMRSP